MYGALLMIDRTLFLSRAAPKSFHCENECFGMELIQGVNQIFVLSIFQRRHVLSEANPSHALVSP
jgi:hypothetical protein